MEILQEQTASPDAIALTDDQIAAFVRDGIVVVQTTHPPQFHAELDSRTRGVIEKEGNWGNNILPQVPQLQFAYDDPAARGGLSAVLGRTYEVHPHRYAHLNPPGNPEQTLHKDSYGFSGDRHLRHHHPRWALALYYPHDVTPDMGPTSVVPRSQYYLESPHAGGASEMPVPGVAGSVAIVHFDIWHRGTTNRANRPRLMVKFEFTRLDEPTAPQWDNQRPDWEVEDTGPHAPHNTLWSHMWCWLRGSAWTPPASAPASPLGPRDLASPDVTTRRAAGDVIGLRGPDSAGAIDALTVALRDADEPVRLNAAYALGSIGGRAIERLVEALVDDQEPVRRAAGYGLALLGEAAAERLDGMVAHDDEEVRLAAIDVLGDLGAGATGVVAAVASSITDPNPWVRRQAAEALGTIGADDAPAVDALTGALRDGEAFVRVNAGLALARIASRRPGAVTALAHALGDPDRYVRGTAVMALRRAGTPEAAEALIAYLSTARWCPDSTPAHPY